jgi:hypothetical protein
MRIFTKLFAGVLLLCAATAFSQAQEPSGRPNTVSFDLMILVDTILQNMVEPYPTVAVGIGYQRLLEERFVLALYSHLGLSYDRGLAQGGFIAREWFALDWHPFGKILKSLYLGPAVVIDAGGGVDGGGSGMVYGIYLGIGAVAGFHFVLSPRITFDLGLRASYGPQFTNVAASPAHPYALSLSTDMPLRLLVEYPEVSVGIRF